MSGRWSSGVKATSIPCLSMYRWYLRVCRSSLSWIYDVCFGAMWTYLDRPVRCSSTPSLYKTLLQVLFWFVLMFGCWVGSWRKALDKVCWFFRRQSSRALLDVGAVFQAWRRLTKWTTTENRLLLKTDGLDVFVPWRASRNTRGRLEWFWPKSF